MKIIKEVGERLLPSWLAAELRPILVFTGTGAALWAGSCELVCRAWQWLGQRLGVWERLGALTVGAYLVGYGCLHAPHIARFAIPGAAIAWCAAAWWSAPQDSLPEPVEAGAPEPPGATPQDVYTATLEWIRRQIGERQGVHLRDLLEHAQVHGMFEDLDVSELRGHLERAGIPVRNRVRVRGLGVTVGVHRDDLPPLPEPLPDRDSQDPPDSGLHPVRPAKPHLDYTPTTAATTGPEESP
jgi:hypothetical protein